jgi:hypothetical protein
MSYLARIKETAFSSEHQQNKDRFEFASWAKSKGRSGAEK